MPLVTFTGLPSSGKTRYAKQLVEALQKKIAEAQDGPAHGYTVVYHSDETLGISHDTYRESNLEKHARGTQMSAVKRDLSRHQIVVLDSLAYIKGFRYQLFCEAKGIVTPHAVVHVIAPVEKCLEWNNTNSTPWDPEIIRQLEMRYEEPNPDSRWDLPLFNLVSSYDEPLPVDEIWDALVLKKPPPPNAATVVKATSGTNFLQELDKRTQLVITKVVQHQQLVAIGGDVNIEEGVFVEMPSTPVSIAQLQRIRRSFIALNRMRSVAQDRIVPLFVEYINKSLNE